MALDIDRCDFAVESERNCAISWTAGQGVAAERPSTSLRAATLPLVICGPFSAREPSGFLGGSVGGEEVDEQLGDPLSLVMVDPM
jgi:hypothetical protein